MIKRLFVVTLMLAATTAFAEPSISEVYKAAEAGQVQQAKAMMDEVLKAHPNSAKAHFVEAELFARDGNLSGARAELAKARELDSSLSFAKPQSMQALQRQLGLSPAASPRAAATSGVPSWVWFAGIGLILLMVFRLFRNTATSSAPMSGAMATSSPYGATPGPMGYPAPSSGSGLLGSLATGAAIGGGIVAGEALAHHFLGGDESRRDNESNGFADQNTSANNDLGGDNFGVSDSDSWDDNSGSW